MMPEAHKTEKCARTHQLYHSRSNCGQSPQQITLRIHFFFITIEWKKYWKTHDKTPLRYCFF